MSNSTTVNVKLSKFKYFKWQASRLHKAYFLISLPHSLQNLQQQILLLILSV